jgi:hypothetical protein
VNPLQWEEDREVQLGEGVSRTSSERAKLYELRIWLPGQGAMRDLVRAESLKQAIEFAQNRYPKCRVDVPGSVAGKPKLARSSPGPKETARRRLKLVEKQSEQH